MGENKIYYVIVRVKIGYNCYEEYIVLIFDGIIIDFSFLKILDILL